MTMDSDSASQDSDNGRRFRFETTRKDSVIPMDTSGNTMNSPRKKSKHKFQCENIKRHQDKKESRNESSRKIDYKDLGYSAKHSKRESRSSKQEDGKISYDNDRNVRDASVRLLNDRDCKNFNDDAWERSPDSKWRTDRHRNGSVHRSQQSRERSYDKNHHDDRNRNQYHERYKRHSCDKNWNRSHHSNRAKSSNSSYRSRDNHESRRHDSFKKTSIEENESLNSRGHFLFKNVEQTRDHNNARSENNNLKRNLSERGIQDCKELNLEFGILSKADESASDDRNSRSRTSSPHSRKIKLKRYDPEDQFETLAKQMRKNNDETRKTKRWEELSEIKRKSDSRSGSSNNDSIMSGLHNTASTPLLTMTEIHKSEKEKSRYYEREDTDACHNTNEHSNLKKKNSRCRDVSSDDTRLVERDVKQNGLTYGPFLPPGFISDTSNGDKFEKISSTVFNESKIDKNDKEPYFMEPCLSPQSNKKEINAENIVAANVTFGPVLPPHLLQQNDIGNGRTQDKIIGPVLPTTDVKLCKKDSYASSECDDYGIGPLPPDHPALRNSRVYEQLNSRAEKIRNERSLEMIDVGNQREEWMTDLPPVQAANLGLGPRKFKLRDGPDMSDRSCWTDTPMQKARKQKNLETKVYSSTTQSDTKYVKEFLKEELDRDRKCSKSLLEMHQKEVAKKKKNEEREAKRIGISTRRPFDRDVDLQIHRLNQAQKKTILLQAQSLDNRFSRGQI